MGCKYFECSCLKYINTLEIFREIVFDAYEIVKDNEIEKEDEVNNENKDENQIEKDKEIIEE